MNKLKVSIVRKTFKDAEDSFMSSGLECIKLITEQQVHQRNEKEKEGDVKILKGDIEIEKTRQLQVDKN